MSGIPSQKALYLSFHQWVNILDKQCLLCKRNLYPFHHLKLVLVAKYDIRKNLDFSLGKKNLVWS